MHLLDVVSNFDKQVVMGTMTRRFCLTCALAVLTFGAMGQDWLMDVGAKSFPLGNNVFTLTNCRATEIRNAVFEVVGMEDSYLENFKIANLKASAPKAGRILFANNWVLENIELRTDNGEPLVVDNCRDVKQRDVVVLKK